MANFKDNSSNYNGKSLKAVIRVSDTEIIEANLYYATAYEQKTNQYGIKWNEPTGLYNLVLNVGRMTGGSGMYSGGIGRTIELSHLHKRRTLKALEQAAADLTDDGITANAGPARASTYGGNGWEL